MKQSFAVWVRELQGSPFATLCVIIQLLLGHPSYLQLELFNGACDCLLGLHKTKKV
jgi:hypothetical protein